MLRRKKRRAGAYIDNHRPPNSFSGKSDGRVVAVKELKAGSGQGEREFRAEVEIISRVHHRHLVSLVGYCIAEHHRLLVYEFVPNDTLEHHLHGKAETFIDWPKRVKIAIGAAKGLAYLHEDCHPRIIHRDIKSANILLDNSFEAQVADFGLAKLTNDAHTHVSTRVMGTFGGAHHLSDSFTPSKVAPSPETEVNACSDNNDIKAPISKEATVEPVDQDPSTKVQDPNAKLLDHKSLDSIVDPAGDDSQKEGKKKKKKKKSKTQQGNTGAIMEESGFAKKERKKELVENNNEQKAQVRPSKPRTFSNGLVIEELSMGKPDGRKASPGNKVSVHYIGKLKKNEEIFDSNIGRRPFKFRLGVGQVIKGWDVGLAGMRVGDKRRLTIPPSMGYGSKGAGKIPANAWLVFDVELVDVQ